MVKEATILWKSLLADRWMILVKAWKVMLAAFLSLCDNLSQGAWFFHEKQIKSYVNSMLIMTVKNMKFACCDLQILKQI